MHKFCIFCGQEPRDKTDEHVLPQWLLELTGDPNRTVRLGYKRGSDEGTRTFSFNALKFPACRECNNRYGQLESQAKNAINKLLQFDCVSAQEINMLLDWFDKIRTGMWLGYYYLDRNWLSIKLKHTIDTRLGLYDRFLGIYKSSKEIRHLSFCGSDQLSFYYNPSCFSININQLSFTSMSHMFLFSKNIGFPYFDNLFYENGGLVSGEVTCGTGKIEMPMIPRGMKLKGTEIYQPMFKIGINGTDVSQLYDNQYVRSNSLSFDSGAGTVFIRTGNGLEPYPSEASPKWIPVHSYPDPILHRMIGLQTMELQSYIDTLEPSEELLPDGMRDAVGQIKRMKELWNTQIIRMLDEQMSEYFCKIDVLERVAESYHTERFHPARSMKRSKAIRTFSLIPPSRSRNVPSPGTSAPKRRSK